MPRILRAFDPKVAKSLQAGGRKSVQTAQAIGTSKNQVNAAARAANRVSSAVGVKRLFVRDPYNALSAAKGVTVARFSKEAGNLTNSTNVNYDPSKAPGSVQKVSAIASRNSANTPGKASRGHAKVIRRTLFNQNAGKTLLKRR